MSSCDLNNSEDLQDSKNTSIPLLMCDNVKSDRKWYSVRLTPDTETDFARGDVVELIESISVGDWFVCTELSPKKKVHYHLLVASIFDSDDVKKHFTEFLRNIYTDKWKKEDGNKRCNFKPTTDLVQYIKYICKERDYVYGSNINPDYIKWAASKAFKKYSKEAFAVALQDIKNSYQEDQISSKQLKNCYY